MKIASACIYALKIPFVESFSHSLSERDCSDSIVVRVTTESGISGFGEGVPRPYVTGETCEASVEYVKNELLPWIVGTDLDGIDLKRPFETVSSLLPEPACEGAVAWNASRCSLELAVIDCLFRHYDLSVNRALPPASQAVTYSGVITCGTTANVEAAAQRCKAAGFKTIKMKVSGDEDAERVAMVRDILGSSASIRLDANGAFNPDTAIRFLESVEKYDIECIEQPMPRGSPTDLAALRSSSPIPVMADESIVTIKDAHDLVRCKAVDYFNLRISKCGGIHNTLVISEIARSAGIGIQLGCQVGETAILSAAGRHLAAHLQGLRFVEGSYSTHLLVEDISEEDIRFGPTGRASTLAGAGFGITVCETLLNKYAEHTILVS
ncbi:MAG: dipeptide epimerase [Phycisphaerae bacterium]|nr:dipeptide epimerase [Phycisphaerae bacterium]